MRRGADTRDRILDAAVELFHREGYQGTSLAAVQARAGVHGGSLAHFFPTKERLLAAVLDRYRELLDPAILAPAFAAADDPIERIFAVLAQYRRLLLDTDFALGCPIGNLAIQVPDAGPESRAGIAAALDLWTAAIETCLEAAAGRLPAGLDRRGLARFVLTTMEGAVLIARGYRDLAPFDQAVAHLRGYLDALASEAASSRPRSNRRKT